jgi:flagellar basal body-associated protein FliL
MKEVNKKKNNKKKKLLIVIMLVLIVLIIVLVNIVLRLKQNKNKPEPVNTLSWISYKNTISDIYYGDKSTLEINKKIKQVFEVYLQILAPEYEELKTEEELEQYYFDNEDYIKEHLCIYESKEFIKLVDYYRKNKIDVTELGSIEYKKTSYFNNNDYEKVEFTMSFAANKKLTFEARIYDDGNGLFHIELVILQ